MDVLGYLDGASSGRVESDVSPHPKQRPDTYIPGMRDVPWHDVSGYDFVQRIEAAADDIVRELEALEARSTSFQPYREPGDNGEEPSEIHDGGDWDISFLYFEGKRFNQNCSLAPTTAALFEGLPRRAGLACFSRLAPRVHIQPHCAPSNAALRLHLGLVVPDRARMRVGDEVRSWKFGKCAIFDHSFEHEIWGDPDQERIVLIMDFFHPDLSEIDVERLQNRYRSKELDQQNEEWLELFGADRD